MAAAAPFPVWSGSWARPATTSERTRHGHMGKVAFGSLQHRDLALEAKVIDALFRLMQGADGNNKSKYCAAAMALSDVCSDGPRNRAGAARPARAGEPPPQARPHGRGGGVLGNSATCCSRTKATLSILSLIRAPWWRTALCSSYKTGGRGPSRTFAWHSLKRSFAKPTCILMLNPLLFRLRFLIPRQCFSVRRREYASGSCDQIDTVGIQPSSHLPRCHCSAVPNGGTSGRRPAGSSPTLPPARIRGSRRSLNDRASFASSSRC
jgi:hypothetical protein